MNTALLSPPTKTKASPQRNAPPPASRGTVLVVDDEEPNRTLLRDPLEARGYDVIEAANGREALQSVAAHLPDAILLDLMMPGMDGFEVCRKFKDDRRTAHVPVLMVTALSDRRERLAGIEAGANDFLSKPVDVQDLTLRVANAVYAKGLYDQLQAERDRADRLLLNTLPRPIAERMKRGETNIADQHPDITVLLADLVGFTSMSAHIAPEQIVSLLNEIFSAFDLLAEKHGLEKVKTIGDAFMAAAGLPYPRTDHAEATVELAFDLQTAIASLNAQYGTSIHIRIGICSGPVIAGVIGRRKFAYDIWGETVNIACRLEASGEPGSVYVSESTFEKLRNKHRFNGSHKFELKRVGEIIGYRLMPRPSAA